MTTEQIEVLNPEVVGAELARVEQQAGLAEDTAVSLRGQFADYYGVIVTLRESAATVTDPTNLTHQKIAREVRLGLKKVRCEVENVRKTLKAESLSRSKAIDGFANVLKYLCEPIEDKLMGVEQYAERQEQARIATLAADRTQALVAAGADPLTIAAYNLGVMDEETFNAVLAGEKAKIAARVEEARQAEAARIERENADRVAREKAEAESAKLRKEAAEREKAMQAERDKAAKERAQADAKARKERESVEAKAKTDREAVEAKARAEKAIADAKLAEERAKRESAEREVRNAKAREEALERQRQADAAWEREQAEKAARAPDKEKLVAFAEALGAMRCPKMSTPATQAIADTINKSIDDFAKWINEMAGTL